MRWRQHSLDKFYYIHKINVKTLATILAVVA